MKAKLTVPTLAVLAVAGVTSATAFAGIDSTSNASLVIRHQVKGCHAWSANGSAYKAGQTMTIRRGGSITVANNDVMPHKLVETSGPAVKIIRISAGMPGKGMGLTGTFPPAMMARMGAAAKLTFAKAGVYKFTTKPGEDYMSGMQTVGADNVLTLTVTVR